MQTRSNLVEKALENSARQVAALVWRKAGPEPEVLLVTSRISGHWLLPKGWPMEGKSASESAMQEAFEEAGVWGGCDDHPIGSYGYRKVLTGGAALHCTVDVFAVEAVGVLAHWPEREQRRREWVTLAEAAARVMELDLAEFLRRCDERFVDQHFTPIPRSDAMSAPPNLIVARRGRGYDSVRDLWLRTGPGPAVLEKLAEADAFNRWGSAAGTHHRR
ncbi:MAG TPA: NUDIX domain-containing protein [Devosia sp.]|nr:NUDIX domain-containing protein [Devosia sp.]